MLSVFDMPSICRNVSKVSFTFTFIPGTCSSASLGYSDKHHAAAAAAAAAIKVNHTLSWGRSV